MRRLALFLLVALGLNLAPYSALAAEWLAADGSVIVSIIQLIATPEKYHRRKVTVTGFATVEFENDSLCLVERPLSSVDCLWLTLDDRPPPRDEKESSLRAKQIAEFKKYHKKVILVRGVFDMDNRGHFGAYSGGVEQITQIEVRK